MTDTDRLIQDLTIAVQALRESVDCLNDAVSRVGCDEDIDFEPDFAVDDLDLN